VSARVQMPYPMPTPSAFRLLIVSRASVRRHHIPYCALRRCELAEAHLSLTTLGQSRSVVELGPQGAGYHNRCLSLLRQQLCSTRHIRLGVA
jgi:hypothetical protein